MMMMITSLFRKCNTILISSIAFETDFSRLQKLKMLFQTIQSVKFQNLYIDEKISFIFENVQTVNFADSTFGNLSPDNFTMLQSGQVCVSNSILNLDSPRRPKLISKCPWIHSSVNISSLRSVKDSLMTAYMTASDSLRPVKDTSMSLSSLQKQTETGDRNESMKYLSISPGASLATALVFSGLMTVISFIITIAILERRRRGGRQHPTSRPSQGTLSSSDTTLIKFPEEAAPPEIPSPDLKELRRSISAVLMVTHQLRRSNSATLQNVILATEEEFLC